MIYRHVQLMNISPKKIEAFMHMPWQLYHSSSPMQQHGVCSNVSVSIRRNACAHRPPRLGYHLVELLC